MTTAEATLSLILPLKHIFAKSLPQNFPLFVGPPPGGDVPSEYAAVAYGGDDRPDILSTPTVPDWGNRTEQHKEEISIWNCVSTASGDQDGYKQMKATADYLQTIGTELKKDPTLGGVIDAGGYASLGAHEWMLDNGGQIATVFFLVVITLPWVD